MSAQRRIRNQNPDNPSLRAETEDAINLIEFFYCALSSWKLILGLTVALTIISCIYTNFFVTPKYQATSTIYVLSRSDSAIDMTDLQVGAALTSDYVKVFDMWEVHEKVISNLGLPYTYKQMSENLTVENTSGTRMVYISFESESPEEAAAVANEYANVASRYIADTMATDMPNIMSSALVPTVPVSPKKTRGAAIAFLIGLITSMVIVTVRFITKDTYKTPDDISRYAGLNVLAEMPLDKRRNNGKEKIRS